MRIHREGSMTTKTVPFRPNPLVAWVFGPQAVSLVGCDGKPAPAASVIRSRWLALSQGT